MEPRSWNLLSPATGRWSSQITTVPTVAAFMSATFRLMTVNLLHQRCDAADFARLLEKTSPDVVVTQELGPMCADVIASAFPNHRLRPALGFLGRGIATRFDAEFGQIEMRGRPGTSAVLDVNGMRLRLAGAHLINPIQFPWWTSVRTRGHQLAELFQWLEEDSGPVLVAGDFNASPRWPVYRQMTRRLDDLVADWAEREGVRPERTWGWRPGWPRMLRIDHVFGSRAVRAVGVVVEPVVGTDHDAVVVDIEVSGTPG